MATIKFPGLDEYERKLASLGEAGKALAGQAIYKGAGIIADQIRENITQLQAVDDVQGLVAYNTKQKAPLTKSAKAGLLDSLGISKMAQSDGVYYVKIGFDGYNGIKTKKFPTGQPNAMIARSLESGSSIATKRPFVRPAVNAKQAEVEAAMAEIFENGIKAIMEKE